LVSLPRRPNFIARSSRVRNHSRWFVHVRALSKRSVQRTYSFGSVRQNWALSRLKSEGRARCLCATRSARDFQRQQLAATRPATVSNDASRFISCVAPIRALVCTENPLHRHVANRGQAAQNPSPSRRAHPSCTAAVHRSFGFCDSVYLHHSIHVPVRITVSLIAQIEATSTSIVRWLCTTRRMRPRDTIRTRTTGASPDARADQRCLTVRKQRRTCPSAEGSSTS
jgi:hypothetical protein